MLQRLGTIVVTAILVSAGWIFYSGITGGGADGTVDDRGDKAVVDPSGAPSVTVAEAVVVGPTGLAIPVAGVRAAQLVDTFTQARAGGDRVHDAIDIMAARGTPVFAAAPGTIEKLYFSEGGGGISAYVRSQDKRWIYYYAHLDSYAPGIAEGQTIARGAPIGTVGFTGNANPEGPHLHFAIHRMGEGEAWHQGAPVNPYPLLAGTPASR